MILCDRSVIKRYTEEGVWGQATLDALFRKCARARPDHTALVDAPNRNDFTAGPVRRLTFAQKRRWLLDRGPVTVGFGGAAFVTCAIPGLNFLAMPLLVVAGTLLVLRDPPEAGRL